MSKRCARVAELPFILVLAATALAGWGDPLKYNQLDPIDPRTGESWRDHSGGHYFLCADDFVCTEPGRITEIRIAGIDDPYPLGVDLMFWADVPATPTEDSHPGELLYARHMENASPDDPNRIGWYIAGDGTFYVTVPTNDWFVQQGTPGQPIVYWVGVQVYHDIFGFEHFHWKFRQPTQHSGGGAVYSTDGVTWSHWAEDSAHQAQTYAGTLPGGWTPLDLSFQLYGGPEPYTGVIGNASFEIEHEGEMPEGGWAGPLPYRGMPNYWQYRRQGHVNGEGEGLINDPKYNWVSEGAFALYMFASRFGEHVAGDYLEFYQTVDLTGQRWLLFDVLLKGSNYTLSYMTLDGVLRWSQSAAGPYYNVPIDLRGCSGQHELALGVQVKLPFGAFADGHTFFDNLRVVADAPGDMNCDGSVDGADIEPFFLAIADPDGYAAAFPECSVTNADINADGAVDGADIEPFFALLSG